MNRFRKNINIPFEFHQFADYLFPHTDDWWQFISFQFQLDKFSLLAIFFLNRITLRKISNLSIKFISLCCSTCWWMRMRVIITTRIQVGNKKNYSRDELSWDVNALMLNVELKRSAAFILKRVFSSMLCNIIVVVSVEENLSRIPDEKHYRSRSFSLRCS